MLKLVQATRSKWPQSKSSKKSKPCRKMSANVSSNACASLDRVKSPRTSLTPLRISRKSASFQWKQHLTKRRRACELSISRRREISARFYQLTPTQKASVRRAWQTFKSDPFHPSLRAYEIHELSAKAKHTIYSAANRTRFASD